VPLNAPKKFGKEDKYPQTKRRLKTGERTLWSKSICKAEKVYETREKGSAEIAKRTDTNKKESRNACGQRTTKGSMLEKDVPDS
jgi:hypothetical protein